MPKQIIVKPGETLSQIAQRELGSGARWKELGGIPSQVLADPRKLQVGTVLTVPTASVPTYAPGEAQERAKELTSTLQAPTSTSASLADIQKRLEEAQKTALEIQTGLKTSTPTTPLKLDDIRKIQTDLSNASKERKNAYDELIGIQTKTYESEYNKAGLGNLKAKVADIDTQIDEKKKARTEEERIRDESINRVRTNPYYSAATITGETEAIQRQSNVRINQLNDEINRLIDQRNSIAGQYNSGIEDITRKVAYATKDAETKYAYWDSEEKRLAGLLKDYQTELAKQLERAEEPSKTIGSSEVGYWQWNPTTKKYDIQIIPPKAPEAKLGQLPTDIETYARNVLKGYSETSIPQEIRTKVMRRVEELRQTERTRSNEEIRAWIRNMLNSDEIKILETNEKKKQTLRDIVLLDKELTEADKQQVYLILDEMLPSEPTPTKRKSLWEWLGF